MTGGLATEKGVFGGQIGEGGILWYPPSPMVRGYVAYDGVFAVKVAAMKTHLPQKRLQAVYVGPAEAGGVEPGAGGALHDAVVQGDLGAFGVGTLYKGALPDVLLPAAE